MNKLGTREQTPEKLAEVVVKISPRFVGRVLAVAIGVIVILGILVQVARHVYGRPELRGVVRLFDMEQENNVPSWTSTFLFALISLVLFFIGAALRQCKGRDWKYWIGMGCLAMYLSVDDGASLHEMYPNWMSDEQLASLPRIFAYEWLLIGIPFAIVSVSIFARFLTRLPRRTALGMLLAGGVFVAGALGVEMLSGWYRAGLVEDKKDFTYAMMVVVEEGLEFTGAAMFLCVLLAYLRDEMSQVRVRVSDAM